MGLFAHFRASDRRKRAGGPDEARSDGPEPSAAAAPHHRRRQSADSDLGETGVAGSVTVLRLEADALAVVDLTPLDSVRTRIKGSAYYVTDEERRSYGGRDYLLVREPDNAVDDDEPRGARQVLELLKRWEIRAWPDAYKDATLLVSEGEG